MVNRRYHLLVHLTWPYRQQLITPPYEVPWLTLDLQNHLPLRSNIDQLIVIDGADISLSSRFNAFSFSYQLLAQFIYFNPPRIKLSRTKWIFLFDDLL